MSQNQRGGMILSAKIDVTKINKELLFPGKNGKKYLDITLFVDNEQGQYGDNGMVVQDVGKERRREGEKGLILGNCRIMKGAVAGNQERGQDRPLAPQMNEQARQAQRSAAPPAGMDDDDVPF